MDHNPKFQEALLDPQIAQALGYAIAKHGAQKYGDQPYQTHLLRVAQTVFEVGRNGTDSPTVLVVAALLHDVLEDTETTDLELSEQFGPLVVNIVKACTKDEEEGTPKELQCCRRCSFKKTVPALRSTPGAKAVKLADRLANMENSLETRSTHLNMYVREYPEFKSLLWREGEYPELWKRLDDAFEAGTRRKK